MNATHVMPSTNISRLRIPPLHEQYKHLCRLPIMQNRGFQIPIDKDRLGWNNAEWSLDSGIVLVPKPSLWHPAGSFVDPHALALAGALEQLRPRGRAVTNWCTDPLDLYRVTPHTEMAWKKIEERTRHGVDFWPIRVSCDLIHAGKTPAYANETLRSGEYGGDAYIALFAAYLSDAVGPIGDRTTFHISCPGAMYDPKDSRKWADTPRLDIECGEWTIDWNWCLERPRALYHNLTFSLGDW